MTQSTALIVTLRQYAETLQRHWRLVAYCTAGFTLFAVVFAAARPEVWKATQAMVVRDEAVGRARGSGRFDSVDAMQTAQETILEVSRNPTVVQAALVQAGPHSAAPRNWPAQRDLEDLQARIKVSAPKGAEFGRTELIYLSVTGESRERALTLAGAVFEQLEKRLQGLRDAKAASVQAELEKQLQLAQADLADATARLAALEREVGSDLGELRTLNQSGVGDSNLRTVLNQITAELRQAETAFEAVERQREILAAAKGNPEQLIATPNRLLESQPSLRKLKEGLVDAQLRKSELLGRMSPDHPNVLAAVAAEREVRTRLHDEIDVALRGLEAELSVNRAQIDSLRQQRDGVKGRLDKLAALRAPYANLASDVSQRAQIVENVKKDLADARAARSAAKATSLLTPVDSPFAGDKPEGPSRAAIVLCGLVGGLACGVGLALLISAPVGQQGRRWSDYLASGRRATDRAPPAAAGQGRRAGDPPPKQAAAGDRRGAERRQGDRRQGSQPADGSEPAQDAALRQSS